jgi:hypothetical protein
MLPFAAGNGALRILQTRLYDATDPDQVIKVAWRIAKPLASLIDAQNLAVDIGRQEFVKVEGWTTMLARLGIVPREISVTEQDGTFVAIVALVRMSDGQLVTQASSASRLLEAIPGSSSLMGEAGRSEG